MRPAHLITLRVQNHVGTLNRLVSMFRRRSYSINSLTAGDCEEEGCSRLTLVVGGDGTVVDQCVRQMAKLIDVLEVEHVEHHDAVQRELALIQVSADPAHRREVLDIAAAMAAQVMHLSPVSLTLSMSDMPVRIDSLIALLRPYGILQIARSGLVALKTEN
jgi:acetolactate synthase-1/3 small subunit